MRHSSTLLDPLPVSRLAPGATGDGGVRPALQIRPSWANSSPHRTPPSHVDRLLSGPRGDCPSHLQPACLASRPRRSGFLPKSRSRASIGAASVVSRLHPTRARAGQVGGRRGVRVGHGQPLRQILEPPVKTPLGETAHPLTALSLPFTRGWRRPTLWISSVRDRCFPQRRRARGSYKGLKVSAAPCGPQCGGQSF